MLLATLVALLVLQAAAQTPAGIQSCIDELGDLDIDTISQECDITYDSVADDYTHEYTINFNGFQFETDSCFYGNLYSGTDMNNTPVPLSHTINADNTMTFDFSYKDAASNNCHVTETEKEYKQACFFQFDIILSASDVIQQEI